MATKRTPPVIAEIAKAYQNDPSTLMALSALREGSSTAPVAEGKYAVGDGIARIAQALGGAYMNKQQVNRYGAEEDALLAQRAKMGADGLSGLTPQTAPANPSTAAPQAAQIAAALGSPPPAQAAPAPAMAPPSPMQPGGLPQGGGPGGQGPFGRGSAPAPGFLARPIAEALPEAPQAMAMPTRPEAVGPTRSKSLEAAYRLMGGANRYESDRAMGMYEAGLGEQTKLNESATERVQNLIDAEYGTQRGIYADSVSQDRGNAYAERRGTVDSNRRREDAYSGRQFEYGVHKEDQAFTARENAANRANARGNAQISAAGKGTENGRKLPVKIATGYAENRAAIAAIQKAIDQVKAHPKAMGLANLAGDNIRQRQDPKGVGTRADVANIGSLKRHDRTGAAMTIGEAPFLKPFIPGPLDNDQTTINKLTKLAEDYMNQNSAIEVQFGEEAGYEPLNPTGEVPGLTAPAASGGWGKATVVR